MEGGKGGWRMESEIRWRGFLGNQRWARPFGRNTLDIGYLDIGYIYGQIGYMVNSVVVPTGAVSNASRIYGHLLAYMVNFCITKLISIALCRIGPTMHVCDPGLPKSYSAPRFNLRLINPLTLNFGERTRKLPRERGKGQKAIAQSPLILMNFEPFMRISRIGPTMHGWAPGSP